MFKIGDLVTKEQFIKYAPYGMELKHDSAEVILRYDMKAYEDFSEYIEDWVDAIPGFMYCSCGYVRPEPMDGVWSVFEDNIEEYGTNGNLNLYRIHKLPILKLLKRKPL